MFDHAKIKSRITPAYFIAKSRSFVEGLNIFLIKIAEQDNNQSVIVFLLGIGVHGERRGCSGSGPV